MGPHSETLVSKQKQPPYNQTKPKTKIKKLHPTFCLKKTVDPGMPNEEAFLYRVAVYRYAGTAIWNRHSLTT